jgi:hypothetical protein
MMHDPFLHIEASEADAAGLLRHPRFAILALILTALSASGVLAGLFWICGRMASIASTIVWSI